MPTKACDSLAEFLTSLPATGAKGFEGLVAVLCTEATGQRFRLSGAGAQHGQDAGSEPGVGNCIKVETKRYKDSSLDLRDLLGELDEATRNGQDLDLWVLAASCPVKAQHSDELLEAASRHGVTILILDLDGNLPRLGVLMAEFETRLSGWVTEHHPEKNALVPFAQLEQIRNHGQFVAVRDCLLKKMTSSLLGYEDALLRVRKEVLRVIRDRDTSLSAFNQDAAIRSPNVRFVRRCEIDGSLNQWWASSGRRRAVLLGEEGTGKTWVVFDWLVRQMEQSALTIVLPMSVNADIIRPDEGIMDVLPRLLRKWTHQGTDDFWRKRLHRWLESDDVEHPRILVLVDGLNERPRIQWPSFFAGIEDERLRRKIGLLVTDRPLHWLPRVKEAGMRHVTEIPVKGYTDAELEDALKGRDVRRDQVPEGMRKLICTPRYLDLVCTHFKAMMDQGDLTIERLIFLDIRDRVQRKRGSISELELIDIIRELARKSRVSSAITLTEVAAIAAPFDSGGRVCQEIIDGNFLAGGSGSGRYVVERDKLIFGLGLLLSDEIRDGCIRPSCGPIVLEQEISQFFEPNRDIDLKVRICESALYHSLQDSSYPSVGRQELLRYWLGLRNWDDNARDEFANHVMRYPADLLAVADGFWSSTHDRGAAQEFLVDALVQHRNDARVQPQLVSTVRRWMGFVHAAGPPVFRADPNHEQARRDEIATRVGRPLTTGLFQVAGEDLTVVEDDGLLRLRQVGFLIISHGSRLPFLKCFVAWAVGSAVVDSALDTGTADWVVRLTDEDLTTPLRAEIERLRGLNEPVAQIAARTLLWRVDIPEASALRKQAPLSESDLTWATFRDRHVQDPCISGYAWSDDDCRICMDRTDIHVRAIIGKLSERVSDPDFHPSETFLRRVEASVAEIDAGLFRESLSRTADDLTFGTASEVLASRRPETLANFIRNVVVRYRDRSAASLYPLANWLPDITLALDLPEAEELRRILERVHTEMVAAAPAKDLQVIESQVFLALVPHMQFGDLCTCILNRPDVAWDLTVLEHWFGPVPTEQAETVKAQLHSGKGSVLLRSLWLLPQVGVSLAAQDRTRLIQLAEEPKLREFVARAACLLQDQQLGTSLVETYIESEPNFTEAASGWLINVIIRYSHHLPFSDIVRQMHPPVASFVLANRPKALEEVLVFASLEEVLVFASLIDRCLNFDEDTAPVSTFPAVTIDADDSEDDWKLPKVEDDGQPLRRDTWFAHPSMTWRSQPADQEALAHRFDDDDRQVEARNSMALEVAQQIAASMKSRGLPWLGRFSRRALRLISDVRPDLVDTWGELAAGDGRSGVLLRHGSGEFAAALCAVLLDAKPILGVKLWKALLFQHKTLVSFFDAAKLLWSAADSGEVVAARSFLFESIHDDAGISKVALEAERANKRASAIAYSSSLLSAGPLWRRAKALTFVSFLDIPLAEFDLYVAAADVQGTWVAEVLQGLQNNVRRNHYAKHWYRVYLNHEDHDVSWGALQAVLRCADSRFLVWRRELDSAVERTSEVANRRLRFVASKLKETRRRIDRSRERRDTLFGKRIPRGEIWPFQD